MTNVRHVTQCRRTSRNQSPGDILFPSENVNEDDECTEESEGDDDNYIPEETSRNMNSIPTQSIPTQSTPTQSTPTQSTRSRNVNSNRSTSRRKTFNVEYLPFTIYYRKYSKDHATSEQFRYAVTKGDYTDTLDVEDFLQVIVTFIRNSTKFQFERISETGLREEVPQTEFSDDGIIALSSLKKGNTTLSLDEKARLEKILQNNVNGTSCKISVQLNDTDPFPKKKQDYEEIYNTQLSSEHANRSGAHTEIRSSEVAMIFKRRFTAKYALSSDHLSNLQWRHIADHCIHEHPEMDPETVDLDGLNLLNDHFLWLWPPISRSEDDDRFSVLDTVMNDLYGVQNSFLQLVTICNHTMERLGSTLRKMELWRRNPNATFPIASRMPIDEELIREYLDDINRNNVEDRDHEDA